MTLHLTIVTPEKILEDREIDELIVPTTTGEISILPHHVPLVTQLAAGTLIIKSHGRDEVLVVDGGFVQVNEKEIIVLADFAIHGNDISATKAEEAKKLAEKAMKEAKTEMEIETLQDEIRRAALQLKLAGLHKNL